MKTLKEDAVALLEGIDKAFPISQSWIITHAAIIPETDSITLRTAPPLLCFSYRSPVVLEYLEQSKVIVAKENGLWFSGIEHDPRAEDDIEAQDEDALAHNAFLDNTEWITLFARKNKYIREDDRVGFYYDFYDRNGMHFGPQPKGLVMLLVDRDRLKALLTELKGDRPVFDMSSGVMSYLGKSVSFKGEQSQRVSLLISKINSVVQYKDFCEAGAEIYPATSSTRDVDNRLKNSFSQIKKKIKSRWGKALVLCQSDGFGLFIDQGQRNLP